MSGNDKKSGNDGERNQWAGWVNGHGDIIGGAVVGFFLLSVVIRMFF